MDVLVVLALIPLAMVGALMALAGGAVVASLAYRLRFPLLVAGAYVVAIYSEGFPKGAIMVTFWGGLFVFCAFCGAVWHGRLDGYWASRRKAGGMPVAVPLPQQPRRRDTAERPPQSGPKTRQGRYLD